MNIIGFLSEFMDVAEKNYAKNQARRKEEYEAKMSVEKEKARRLYRSGCSCITCNLRNNTNFCDNPRSLMFDKQTHDTSEVYGVGVCPYWQKKPY